MSASDVRHISVAIDRPPGDVFAFASRPENLPLWARGLATSIARRGDDWIAQSPMGPVTVRFAPRNDLGVLDHDVTLESGRGESVHNPLRVVPRPDGGSEIVFTLFRRPGMSDTELEADAAAVLRDLRALKATVEQDRGAP